MEPRPEGPWGSLGGTRVVVMSGRGPEVAGEAMSPMGGGGGDAAGLAGLPLSHGHTHAISQGGACQDQTCEGRGGWEAAGQEGRAGKAGAGGDPWREEGTFILAEADDLHFGVRAMGLPFCL